MSKVLDVYKSKKGISWKIAVLPIFLAYLLLLAGSFFIAITEEIRKKIEERRSS